MPDDKVLNGIATGTLGWAGIAMLLAADVVLAAMLYTSAPTLPWPASFVGLLLGSVLTLALVSSVFKFLGLANPKEAFGLPSGTVRTVLALGVMLLFAVCALTFLASPPEDKDRAWLEKGLPVSVSSKPDQLKAEVAHYEKAGWTVVTTDVGVDDTDAQKYKPAQLKLFREPVPNANRIDMEKQVMTAITALLTTVVGFYFGSRTAESSRDKGNADKTGAPPAPDPIEAGRKALQDETVRQDAAIAAADKDMADLAGQAAANPPADKAAFETALDAAKRLRDSVTAQRQLAGTKLTELVSQQSAAASKPPAERSAFDTPLHAALTAAQDAVKGLGPAIEAWQNGIQALKSLLA